MRKDEKWGFKTYDMKYDPFFPIKVAFANMSPAYPFGSLHWEWLEKEATSDNPLKGCPGLEDLGVTLTQVEDQIPWELRPYRAYQYYMDQIGEFPRPPNPKVVPC